MDNRNIEEVRRNEDRLIERIEYLERSNNRREETILDLRNDIIELCNIIDKISDYVESNMVEGYDGYIRSCGLGILNIIGEKKEYGQKEV